MSEPVSPSVAQRLFSLALPVIGLNVLNVLTLAVDTAMCGRLPDAEASLVGLGFATQIVFLLMVAMMGLTVGTVALVARAHGAGDEDRVAHLLGQSTSLTLVLGALVAVFGNLAAEPILSLLGAEGASLEAGVAYLRPLLGGTVFHYIALLYAAVLRGVGETRLPFLVALGTNALNVFLDYGLILGGFGMPALGIQGAAVGTVVAQAASVLALVLLLRRGVIAGIRPGRPPLAIDGALSWQLFRVGAPAALDLVILNASFLAIIGMLGRLDPLAVAAHGIGLRIQSLAFVPGLAVSQATAAMVGQSLGAGDRDEARAITRASVRLCTLIMSAIAVLLVGGAEPLVRIFDIPTGSPLSELSVLWIRLLGLGMPLVGVHIAFTGMLRGSGSTGTSLSINAVCTLVQIPGSALLGFALALGPLGVWAAFPASFALRALLGRLAFRRGRWARVGLST